MLKPKVILVLGTPAAMMLGELSNELSGWKENRPFSYFDSKGMSLVHGVKFEDLDISCVKLLHPSFRSQNLKHRKYRTLEGNMAEITMVEEALKKQGILPVCSD